MMDHFGEVVHPSSRAFYYGGYKDFEDCNTSEDIECVPSFIFNYYSDAPTKIKNLIVAESRLIVDDFVDLHVTKNLSPICAILSTKYTNKNPSKLYKITDDLYILTVCRATEPTEAGEFIEFISEILQKCENIFAFTWKPVCELLTTNHVPMPSVMRTLCTRKFSNQKNLTISALEQPNIVTGVAAAVVAYAEIMEISAILNVLYLFDYELDSENAVPLIELFSNITGLKFDGYKSSQTRFFNKDKNIQILRKILDGIEIMELIKSIKSIRN